MPARGRVRARATDRQAHRFRRGGGQHRSGDRARHPEREAARGVPDRDPDVAVFTQAGSPTIWKLEKVVSAPQKPVPSSGRQKCIGATRSASAVVSHARNIVPTRLTMRVAHGQCPGGVADFLFDACSAERARHPPSRVKTVRTCATLSERSARSRTRPTGAGGTEGSPGLAQARRRRRRGAAVIGVSVDDPAADRSNHRPETVTACASCWSSQAPQLMAAGDAGGWASAGARACACPRPCSAVTSQHPARAVSSPRDRGQRPGLVESTTASASRRLDVLARHRLDTLPQTVRIQSVDSGRSSRGPHTDTHSGHDVFR